MRAALTADRSITVSADGDPLFVYSYGAPRPGLAGGSFPTPITWLPPLADPGTATHRTLTELSSAPDAAILAHRLRWPAVDEWRSLTTARAGDGWLLLFENTITNVTDHPLPLTGPSLTLPAITAPPAARTEWQAARTAAAAVVVVDDAANLAHPPRWSAGLSPAPFGSGGLPLGPQRTVAFRYAVLVAPADRDAAYLAGLGRAALTGPLPARSPVCPGEHPPGRRAHSPGGGTRVAAAHRGTPTARSRCAPRWP
ncbi:hypothetical protein ACTOB_005409 [Actinoplanes oblitus]|uniref:Uncharacterized protein n=1 Tax=Actinoplanes oblitus TaxID=3040509 RepID=A0ABY8W8Y5_9ACTN|nr:hypothetical protein [Actinoplanes oblitus]WIM93432.1 hypothetical protein ACTOB_005409 [Actinoplanes oblitus]